MLALAYVKYFVQRILTYSKLMLPPVLQKSLDSCVSRGCGVSAMDKLPKRQGLQSCPCEYLHAFVHDN